MVQSLSRLEHSRATLYELGASRLGALCRATGLESEVTAISTLFRRLLAPWGDAPIEDRPTWPSPIGDDHSPFEFSLSLNPDPEVRVLFEPLGNPPGLVSNRRSALQLLESLAPDFALDLDRLERVKNLFLPDEPRGSFALLLAVGFGRRREPEFKVYLDTEAQGHWRAPALVEEAMCRLGVGSLWPKLALCLARRGPYLDQMKCFSLDLKRSAQARIKVYVRHLGCSVAELEEAASALPSPQPHEIARFTRAVAPEVADSFDGRSPLTCFATVGGNPPALASVATHVPVNGYAPDDAAIVKQVCTWLRAEGISTDVYSTALAAYAARSLESGVGLHSYVSLTRTGERSRLTVYLAAEAYRTGWVAEPVDAPRHGAAMELIERFETQNRITDHPYFRRLRREPVDVNRLCLLLANVQISISRNFARWLAGITARVEDDRIRSLLAKQLNEELGNGAFERAHVNLFATMMSFLEPWRPRNAVDDVLAPGRRLTKKLEGIYGSPVADEAMGAVVAGEIFAKQMDAFLGDEFRRQSEIDPQRLEWLMLHEALEVEHADDSAHLVQLLPEQAAASVWKGAMDLVVAGTTFLDELYELTYCGS
jgi:pyrroloquinoline quinone (PQQ) biosynthesis protein C